MINTYTDHATLSVATTRIMGQIGSVDPPGKMLEKIKNEIMQTYADHIFVQ